MVKKQRKIYFFAGILTCLCTFAVFTQTTANRGVQLTATVLSVEPRYSRSCWDYKKNCEFEVDLLLQFRNNGTSPTIVCSPSGFYGDKTISFLKSMSKTSTGSTSTTIKWENPYASYYDPFDNFVRALITADRPFGSFIVLPPDGYHEWRETFVTPLGYKLKVEPDPRRKGDEIRSAAPEYAALKIEYFLSLRKRPEHPNALEKAKENWKEFGNLILDSNGDYRIESEVILNKLP